MHAGRQVMLLTDGAIGVKDPQRKECQTKEQYTVDEKLEEVAGTGIASQLEHQQTDHKGMR